MNGPRESHSIDVLRAIVRPLPLLEQTIIDPAHRFTDPADVEICLYQGVANALSRLVAQRDRGALA
jgi:hypothetical protein